LTSKNRDQSSSVISENGFGAHHVRVPERPCALLARVLIDLLFGDVRVEVLPERRDGRAKLLESDRAAEGIHELRPEFLAVKMADYVALAEHAQDRVRDRLGIVVEPATSSLGSFLGSLWGKGFSAAVAERG